MRAWDQIFDLISNCRVVLSRLEIYNVRLTNEMQLGGMRESLIVVQASVGQAVRGHLSGLRENPCDGTETAL